jgi:DNA-binding transcriptional LysR family regulator
VVTLPQTYHAVRNLNDLGFFAAVVANRGFSSAARALGSPKSRVSRRVAALEAELGVRLVERSARRFRVTAVGQEVYRHARSALDGAEAITEAASRVGADPQGLVRIGALPPMERPLAATLPGLLERFPKLRLQIVLTYRPFDLLDEAIDVAVRVRREPAEPGLDAQSLGRRDRVLVASRAFVATHGSPRTPADVPDFPTISQTEAPGVDRWVLANAAGEEVEIAHEPRLAAAAFTLLRQAALAGVGIAMLPEFACRALLEAGELVRVLPEWALPQGELELVSIARRSSSPAVRVMVDFLHEMLDLDSPAWKLVVED